MLLNNRLLTFVFGIGLCAVCAAMPVFAQSSCADLAGKTFGNALVLESEATSGSTEIQTAFGGGAVLIRPTCRVRGQIKLLDTLSRLAETGCSVWNAGDRSRT